VETWSRGARGPHWLGMDTAWVSYDRGEAGPGISDGAGCTAIWLVVELLGFAARFLTGKLARVDEDESKLLRRDSRATSLTAGPGMDPGNYLAHWSATDGSSRMEALVCTHRCVSFFQVRRPAWATTGWFSTGPHATCGPGERGEMSFI